MSQVRGAVAKLGPDDVRLLFPLARVADVQQKFMPLAVNDVITQLQKGNLYAIKEVGAIGLAHLQTYTPDRILNILEANTDQIAPFAGITIAALFEGWERMLPESHRKKLGEEIVAAQQGVGSAANQTPTTTADGPTPTSTSDAAGDSGSTPR